MAKMIPQDITQLPPKATQGEKAFYRIIERHTPNDWICYALQRIRSGGTPDFLLIGPDLGVLILEEKSIPLNFIKKITTETWSIVESGEVNERTHPLRQARGYIEDAITAMKTVPRLKDEKGRLKFVYGHGVVLSNIRREELTQGTPTFATPPISTFEKDRVICDDELPIRGQKESDLAQRLKKMTNLFKFNVLDDGDIQSIRGAIFPEIRARVLADELLDRNDIIEVLTIEQEQFARGIGKNDKVPHRLLSGVAGCGKTIILKARAANTAMENPDWRILLTFFTRSLKNYLGSGLPSNIDVMTIGQSIHKQFQKYNLDMEIFNVKSEEGWHKMLEILKEQNLSKGIYDAIFLDESQDLAPIQADYLRHLLSDDSNCAFFCGDLIQNIFRKKHLKWIEHGFSFKGRSNRMDLSVNYRNTEQIFKYAWSFIEKDLNKKFSTQEDQYNETGLKYYMNISFKRRGPNPYFKPYESDKEECSKVCWEINRLITQDRIAPSKIAILHPNATKTFEKLIENYLDELKKYEIPVYWLSKGDNSKIQFSPKNNTVTLSTPDSGKGLEWDIVFMPSIEKYNGDHPNNLRFVCATRALHILYPSACGEID